MKELEDEREEAAAKLAKEEADREARRRKKVSNLSKVPEEESEVAKLQRQLAETQQKLKAFEKSSEQPTIKPKVAPAKKKIPKEDHTKPRAESMIPRNPDGSFHVKTKHKTSVERRNEIISMSLAKPVAIAKSGFDALGFSHSAIIRNPVRVTPRKTFPDASKSRPVAAAKTSSSKTKSVDPATKSAASTKNKRTRSVTPAKEPITRELLDTASSSSSDEGEVPTKKPKSELRGSVAKPATKPAPKYDSDDE